jgi:hypothetical protein
MLGIPKQARIPNTSDVRGQADGRALRRMQLRQRSERGLLPAGGPWGGAGPKDDALSEQTEI